MTNDQAHDDELGRQLLQMLALPAVDTIVQAWSTFTVAEPTPAGWIAQDQVSPMKVATATAMDAMQLHSGRDWEVQPLYSANQMAASCARIAELMDILTQHGIPVPGDPSTQPKF